MGSRTISKFPGVSLSSATIRNEMSDLEELGYIVQPHTSAGRIPSDKGYRFYVDHLLDVEEDEADDAKDLLLKKTEKLEELLKQVVQLLAKTTQYPSVVSAPALSTNRVKFVQLSNVADDQLLCVVVMGGNLVKNRIIEVDEHAPEYESERPHRFGNQSGADSEDEGPGWRQGRHRRSRYENGG